jgi:hypothetical protein
MDSIAYLRDPTDNTKMASVIKAHARYTVQSAKLLAETLAQRYNKYDRTNNNMAARTYLLASLSTELSNKVTEKLDDSDSFPVVWHQFLKSIQSTSIERFEDLKAIIKARLPSQYSGENLEQLAAHFRKDANELTTAGHYDHNLTLGMLKIFLLAGGSGNEDFCFPLRSVKQKLEQALLDIGFKEKEAVNLHMQVNKLTYKDICAHSEDAYRTLFDRKEWSPARHTCDSKAPPAAFGNMATPITRAEVLNLIQSKRFTNGAGSAKNGVCHKCNKPGHWLRKCPENNKGKAGMATVGTKDQRMPSPGSLLRLHLEHLKSSKPMARLSIGVQAASVGPLRTQQQHTLVGRKVLMELKEVALQSTMSPLPLTHRSGLQKLRLSQV